MNNLTAYSLGDSFQPFHCYISILWWWLEFWITFSDCYTSTTWGM